MLVAIMHAAFMQLFPFLMDLRGVKRIPFFRQPVVDMQTDQCLFLQSNFLGAESVITNYTFLV